MKKLLLLISSVSLIYSCHSYNQPQVKKGDGGKLFKPNNLKTDTSLVYKDSTKTKVIHKHKGPNQEKVDSLKNYYWKLKMEKKM